MDSLVLFSMSVSMEELMRWGFKRVAEETVRYEAHGEVPFPVLPYTVNAKFEKANN